MKNWPNKIWISILYQFLNIGNETDINVKNRFRKIGSLLGRFCSMSFQGCKLYFDIYTTQFCELKPQDGLRLKWKSSRNIEGCNSERGGGGSRSLSIFLISDQHYVQNCGIREESWRSEASEIKYGYLVIGFKGRWIRWSHNFDLVLRIEAPVQKSWSTFREIFLVRVINGVPTVWIPTDRSLLIIVDYNHPRSSSKKNSRIRNGK